MARSKYKKVSGADRFKIRDWLVAHWPEILTEKPTYPATAKRIQAELGIETNHTSLAPIIRDAGLTWPITRQSKLRGRSNQLIQHHRIIAGWVAALYENAGMPRPAGMSEMIAGKPHDADAGPLFEQPQ